LVDSHKIVIIGFGSIGQAVIPLLQKHFGNYAIWVIDKSLDPLRQAVIGQYHLSWLETRVSQENYREIVSPLLGAGDFVLNLATSVSSRDLLELAQQKGAFYLDTCIDPWEYAHSDRGIGTSNYALREQVLARRESSAGKPTAVVANGANPGFVSILVKQALLQMATRFGAAHQRPGTANDWALLTKTLDVRVIQISERDTQCGTIARSQGEFVNTWSVDGFVTECLQPAELGWGTHEAALPEGARLHDYGCRAAIALDQPSYTVRVRSWSPNFLDFEGYLITHHEAIALADYLTYREDDRPVYRPTTYYAYHPCDEAVESLSLLCDATTDRVVSARVLMDEICSGIDELGVFLLSGTYPSLWLGSNLSIGKARKQAGHNNATSLQVVSSVVAGMAWILEHPNRGIVESEDLDHELIYRIVEEYWSPIVSQFVEWWPRAGARELQFEDFLV
jgi:homospermidine synthase